MSPTTSWMAREGANHVQESACRKSQGELLPILVNEAPQDDPAKKACHHGGAWAVGYSNPRLHFRRLDRPGPHNCSGYREAWPRRSGSQHGQCDTASRRFHTPPLNRDAPLTADCYTGPRRGRASPPGQVVDTARHDVERGPTGSGRQRHSSPSMRMVDPAGSRTSRTARPAAAGRRSSEKPPPA